MVIGAPPGEDHGSTWVRSGSRGLANAPPPSSSRITWRPVTSWTAASGGCSAAPVAD